MSGFASFLFPFHSWLKKYSADIFKADLFAGLTVALVLIPQSMANAQLAGLPAYYGIYAALLPTAVGGLWGGSNHMVIGAVAVISLMTAAALEPLAISGPEGYLAYTALLTLLVGGIQVGLGLLRLGMVVNFLSLPVIFGFTNAAAIIIAVSQLPKLFGVVIDASGPQYTIIPKTVDAVWQYVHAPSLLMAVFALLIMYGAQKFAPRLPSVLLAVVCTTLLSFALHFEEKINVDIEQIQSFEAQTLLRALAQQKTELEAFAKEASEAASLPEGTRIETLARTFKAQERKAIVENIMRNMSLEKDQLHQMLFVGHRQPDGALHLYATHSPGIAAEITPQIAVPPAALLDGKTWRLRITGVAPSLSSIAVTAGGDVVGKMPSGLPRISLPDFSWKNLLLLLPQAIIIAFVGFAESIFIAKSAANQTGARLDSNQALVGQGFANIAGGLCSTGPVAGSFSSSAVNLAAGARTGMACIFAAGAAMVTLLFLTDAASYVPQPVLAAVVIRAVINLVHLKELKKLWIAQWHDGCIALITFCATLFFAPHLDYGVAIGVILSLASFFYRSMHPTIVSLSCGQDNTLRDIDTYGLEECRHIAIIHFQGTLFFGNCGMLEEYVLTRMKRQKHLRHIHLVCSGITQLDASGEESLASLVQTAAKAGIQMSFSGVVGAVENVLYRTGVIKAVGWENIFLTPREAVHAVHKRMQHEVDGHACPLAGITGYREDHFKSREIFWHKATTPESS